MNFIKKRVNKFFSLNRILEYKRAKLIHENGLELFSQYTQGLALIQELTLPRG